MEKTQAKKANALAFILNNKALLLVIFVAITSIVITQGRSLDGSNLLGIARQISVFIIISMGVTIIFTAAEFDMSIGEIIGLCGVTYGLLMRANAPLPLAIISVMGVGLLCGVINGGITRIFKLNSFVLTLATAQIYRGITYILTNGKTIGGMGDSVKYLGQGQVFGVLPVPFLIAMIALVVTVVLMYKTVYGRQLIATGGNAAAARVSGIKVGLIKLSVYLFGGLFASLGAIVLTGRLASALPNMGDGFLMDTVAAVVIGGTSIAGGRVKVMGTLFGVLLIGIINNMLNLTGVSTFYQWIFKGAIIIVAIILDSVTDTFFKKQKVS